MALSLHSGATVHDALVSPPQRARASHQLSAKRPL
jgi:hypothetical protein